MCVQVKLEEWESNIYELLSRAVQIYVFNFLRIKYRTEYPSGIAALTRAVATRRRKGRVSTALSATVRDVSE